MAKFSIYLPDEIQDKLDRIVSKRGKVKRNTVIREAVRQWLSKESLIEEIKFICETTTELNPNNISNKHALDCDKALTEILELIESAN